MEDIMENLSPAVVTAIATIIGAVISGAVSLIVSEWQHSKTIALIQLRLEILEKKMDKHNQIADRMIAVETKLNSLDK